jgi:peroxiredoxin Q/BCP
VSETGAPVNLADLYKQNKYTLVYFYPKAFTGGCTRQGCSIRDSWGALQSKGVVVLGVSTDNVETQKKFKEENHFPFTLISDTDMKVMEAFGVPPAKPGAKVADRQAFLIKDGKVVYADRGVTDKQAENVLDFLSKNGG